MSMLFLQGITYNQMDTVCPHLVGCVLYWQRSGGPVSFCCLAGEQVLDTRTFKLYSSFDDQAHAVAHEQGSVPMTSITLALAPNSPTLQAVFFHASQDKETFRFQSCSKQTLSRVKGVGKPTAARRPPLSSLDASSAAKQQSTQPQESKTAVQPQNINPSKLCSQNTQSHMTCAQRNLANQANRPQNFCWLSRRSVMLRGNECNKHGAPHWSHACTSTRCASHANTTCQAQHQVSCFTTSG